MGTNAEIRRLYAILRDAHARLKVLEDTEHPTPAQVTPAPVAQGDMVVANATPTWSVLTKGGAHFLLKMNAAGTTPAYEAYDWDLIAAAAGADMAHSHQSAIEGATLDHGLALTGRSDDDHTQYLLATGARTGATSQAQLFTNYIRATAGVAAGALTPTTGELRAVNDIDTTTGFMRSTKAIYCTFECTSDHTGAAGTTVAFAAQLHNVGTFYRSVSNTRIHVPEAGVYHVSITALADGGAGPYRIDWAIRHNGNIEVRVLNEPGVQFCSHTGSVNLQMAADDYVDMYIVYKSNSAAKIIGASTSWWTIITLAKCN
jgi:hypothetical protein